MSASRNADAVVSGGEFRSKVSRDEPMTTKGHQPGQKVTAADHAPEFSAQTIPAGTAPADRTFAPNTSSKVPGQGLDSSAMDNDDPDASTSAGDTLGGASSAEVHQGLGQPVQGQTSNELRHDGQHTSSRQRLGTAGLGASDGGLQGADSRLDGRQRALDKGDAAPGQGDTHIVAAEDQIPVSAEEVAAEFD
ncbi:MAG: hypothetical protein M1838_004817 [Thelocarpon superellum]|nr:MAG: hypothetical protein M1838_004817 [Thelocarpon superellum]